MAYPYTDRESNYVSLQDGVHAIFQKSVQHPENVFGQAPSEQFRSRTVNFDQLGSYQYDSQKINKSRGFSGQLPMATSPKLYGGDVQDRMIPEETRVSKVCFNEALENSGPWYLRHFQIWDYAPLLPSIGDVTKDPRYGQQTRGFTTEYKKLI
jgi:hypothetical protein